MKNAVLHPPIHPMADGRGGARASRKAPPPTPDFRIVLGQGYDLREGASILEARLLCRR